MNSKTEASEQEKAQSALLGKIIGEISSQRPAISYYIDPIQYALRNQTKGKSLTDERYSQESFYIGKDGDGVVGDVTREEIDAKLRASEARAETATARLEGKIDTLSVSILARIEGLQKSVETNFEHIQSSIDKESQYNRDSRLVILSTVIVCAFTLAGLLLALVSYGDTVFGRGMVVRDLVHSAIIEQQQSASPTAPAGGRNDTQLPPNTGGKKQPPS